MRHSLRWLVLLALISVALHSLPRTVGGDTVQCTTIDLFFPDRVVGKFHVFRPGVKGADLRWRDLEFMWDTVYAGGLSEDVKATLRRMASTVVDTIGHNPFGAALREIQLDYNYFALHQNALDWYNTTNPRDSISLDVARGTADFAGPPTGG